MQAVCKDIEANGEESNWFFDEGWFFRVCNGEKIAQINGENIPNPMDLWRTRCEINGAVFPAENVKHTFTGELMRLKPTEATFKLFEFFQNEGLKCQH